VIGYAQAYETKISLYGKNTMKFNIQPKFTLVWILKTVAAMLSIGFLLTLGYYVNEVRVARNQTPSLVASMWNRYGQELTLADLSGERKAKLLAIEDPTFMRHHGVDLETPGAGMTTITQGLVKQLYFPEGFRPGIAKIRQTLIAQYSLDSLVSKNEQLRLFLNVSYLGHKDGKAVHGFANGARSYFDKEFTALSDEEFLSLVAMLISPNTFMPGTPAHYERMRRIHAYLSGAYHPMAVLDVEYNGKKSGTQAEEALMAFLRIITDARPTK
jgi:membrane peptidoglycan carboxypeptidase